MRYFVLFLFIFCFAKVESQIKNDEHKKNTYKKVLQILDTYPTLLIGETHRLKEYYDFMLDFLDQPETLSKVDYILVEFGNSLYQQISDDYVSGKNVSKDSLQQIWRNTTQLLVWDSPLYENFFKKVREINQKHKKNVRIILGDPPIDWKKVNTPAEFEKFLSQRDLLPFKLLKEQIEKGNKGIVVFGAMHILSLDVRTGKPTIDKSRRAFGEMLTDIKPKQFYAIWTLDPDVPFSDNFDKTKKIDFLKLADSHFANSSFRLAYGSDISVRRVINGETRWVVLESENWPTMGKIMDGVMYLGNSATSVPANLSVYSKAYIKKLKRRAKIIDDYFKWGNFYQQRLTKLEASLRE